MRKEALCAKTPTEEYLVRARKCEDKADALEATMKELITERVLAASVEMPGVSFPLIHGELMVRSGGCYCERSGELQMERTDYEAKAMGAASARQDAAGPCSASGRSRPRAGLRPERRPGRSPTKDRNNMKFGTSDGKGGIHKGGRIPGSRNRLFARVYQDVLDHWNQPVPGRNISQGMAALEVMRKERPAEYVKVVCSLLPKELLLSDSTVADLNDEQIDTLLLTLRKQVLEHATEPELN